MEACKSCKINKKVDCKSRIIYKDSHWKILYEQGLKKVKRREKRNKVR